MQIFAGSKLIKRLTFADGITEKRKICNPKRIRKISARANENVINEYQKTP